MRMKNKQGIKLFLFILPVLVWVVIFKYLPLWGWSYAFVKYRVGKDLLDCAWVGLENFKDLFGNAVMRQNLWRVLKNTFGIHFLGYLFTPLPMIVAVLLSEVRSTKFQKLVQTITTVPHFVSWVIMFSIVFSMFGYNGIVNVILRKNEMETVNVLLTNKHVWLTQVLWQQWKNLGWNCIVYFAAIAGLDQGIYEAAMVDGATKMQRIRYITIPQLMPTYFVLLIMSIGNFLNTGIDQYLNFGNPLNKEYIEVLDLYVYNLGIGNGQIAYGVAAGVLKSLVAIVLFTAANILSKKVRGSSVF